VLGSRLPLSLALSMHVACSAGGGGPGRSIRGATDAGEPSAADAGVTSRPPGADAGPDACDVAGESRPCFVGDPALAGVGACTLGTQRCDAVPGREFGGSWGACVGSGVPSGEIADGVDNDCDGAIDDGLTPPPLPPVPTLCHDPVEPHPERWTFLAGDLCGATAVNISQGGTFSGDTCTGGDLYGNACSPSGAPESLFFVPRGLAAPEGAGYAPVCITPGFTWWPAAGAGTDCDVSGAGGIWSTGIGDGCATYDNIGFSASSSHWLAVERIGGGCGPFTITFVRVR